MWKRAILAIVFLALGSSTARGVTEIRSAVISAGGTPIEFGNQALMATIGQPLHSVVTASGFEIKDGFWNLVPLSGTATSVGTDLLPRPIRYILHQNTPNPFNPLTAIRFELPHDVDRLNLNLYDIRGRHVVTLYDGPETVGVKSITWRGTDSNGRAVSSGSYFFVMSTSDFRSVLKMMLVR